MRQGPLPGAGVSHPLALAAGLWRAGGGVPGALEHLATQAGTQGSAEPPQLPTRPHRPKPRVKGFRLHRGYMWDAKGRRDMSSSWEGDARLLLTAF